MQRKKNTQFNKNVVPLLLNFYEISKNKKMEIDLVYLWVDGSDPVWQKKRSVFLGNVDENSETNCKGRYANNDELKYSLRSVEKYAPWIRKIFIVTDNQTPDWLDTTNPKIKIIDHKEIMPEVSLPCFNSSVIEYFLYKIPDLSEHFLYANDDMFFNAAVSPDFFYTKDDLPIVRLQRKPFGKLRYVWKEIRGKTLGNYRQRVLDGAVFIEKEFGKFYSGTPHHNIDAYKKTDYRYCVENLFADWVERCLTHHTRTQGGLQRSAFLYYALAVKKAHLKYTNRNETHIMNVEKTDYKKQLDYYNPTLFCLNDSQSVTDIDRERAKRFLENHFSEKSSFEISNFSLNAQQVKIIN